MSNSLHATVDWQAERGRIDAALRAKLPQDPYAEPVLEAMQYSLLNGGKRFRALLLLTVGRLYHLSETVLLDYACALEMIHAYSLIHDDLPAMDDDAERRGKPACHIQFPEGIAILAGDGLLNTAMEILLHTAQLGLPALAASQYMARMAGTSGMIGGQCMDLSEDSGQPKQAEKWLLTMIDRKTAALIRTALLTGPLLAGASVTEVQIFEQMGSDLGRYYQFQDDLLDAGEASSTENTLKKTAFTFYGPQKLASHMTQLKQKIERQVTSLQADYRLDIEPLWTLFQAIFERSY